MNVTDSCTATFNNIVLKYEGRGFSRATSSKKQAEYIPTRTLEEFDRYYKSRPGYAGYKPPVARTAKVQGNAREQMSPDRPKPQMSQPTRGNAAAATVKKTEVQPARRTVASSGLPSQMKGAPTKIRRAVEKVADVSVGATRRNFKRLPAATLVTIVACMMSLILLVGSSVMTGEATNEYSELKSQVNSLANEEGKLAIELDIKNDLRLIEDIAINKLGMVSRDLIVRNYVKLDEEDMIESFAEPETNVGLSTLLSAIAGK